MDSVNDSSTSHDSRRRSTRRRTVALGALSILLLVLLVLLASVASAATSVWNVAAIGGSAGDGGVVIAVVDTGVDAGHPAFGDRVLPQISVEGGPGDGNGHGTHVAGTAAGGTIDCGDGSTGIGVAPGARILPVRVLDDEGRGTVGGVAQGIRAAADRGADVINLSLGPEVALGDLSGTPNVLDDAFDYAWSKGSVPVLAAGNGDLVGAVFGSGYGDVKALVVTATTRDDRKAGYATSVGSAEWGIAAPGGSGGGTVGTDVLSAWPDRQCALLAGTSMAAPHVAGVAAVLRARGLDHRQTVERILSTARSIGSTATYGAGLVDLVAATAGLSASGAVEANGGGSPEVTTPTTTAITAPAVPPATATDATPATATPAAEPPETSDPAPTTTTVPATTIAAGTVPDDRGDEQQAADMALDLESDEGVSAPLTLTAGLACAACWAVLGRYWFRYP